MIFFSFILLSPVFGRLFTKVVYTPIYESGHIWSHTTFAQLGVCNAHHIILLKQTPFNEYESEVKNVYLLDFSTCEDITVPSIICKIAMGQKINGKMRLLYLNKCDLSEIIRPSLLENRQTKRSLDVIKTLDSELYDKIRQWDPSFQLYNHNCQYFGRYINR